jgi:polysaccharide biosynthesis/export protein
MTATTKHYGSFSSRPIGKKVDVMKSRNAKWAGGPLSLALLLTLCSSCLFAQSAAQQSSRLQAESTPADPPPSEAASAASRVHIGGGDLLEVGVFDVPEMTQTVRVTDTGDATFTLIGTVHLGNLTTDEARVLIAQKLRDGNFILSPQVSVLIKEYGTQGVSVLGEVHKPGVYEVLGNRTLLDVLSEAGGPTPQAGASATVKRFVDGSVLTIPLTRDAQTSLEADVQLQPGDKVLIPRAHLVFVLGDVNRPGGFIMQNDGHITAMQALAFAGGNTHTAAISGVMLIHKTGASYTERKISVKKIMHGQQPDVELQAEDILYVPNSTVKSIVYRGLPNIVQTASDAAVYASIP